MKNINNKKVQTNEKSLSFTDIVAYVIDDPLISDGNIVFSVRNRYTNFQPDIVIVNKPFGIAGRLKKGQMIFISGFFKNTSWIGQGGVQNKGMSIIAECIVLLKDVEEVSK